MKRIDSQAGGDAALGRKVLSVLHAAQEPVTTEALLAAVAGEAGWERTSDHAQLEQQINRCIQCCGGLVVRSDSNIVWLIHHTAKCYLEHHGVLNET